MRVKDFATSDSKKIDEIYESLFGGRPRHIEDFHPLELETEYCEVECLLHYLKYGERFAIWKIGQYYYIVNITKREYLDGGLIGENLAKQLLLVLDSAAI